MGWSSANSIFDETARAFIKQVEAGKCAPEAATDILVCLIKELHAGDWDTDDESYAEFHDYAWIAEAFERIEPGLKQWWDDIHGEDFGKVDT